MTLGVYLALLLAMSATFFAYLMRKVYRDDQRSIAFYNELRQRSTLMSEPTIITSPVDPERRCDICDAVSVFGFSTPLDVAGVTIGTIHCETCREHVDDVLTLAMHRAIKLANDYLGNDHRDN